MVIFGRDIFITTRGESVAAAHTRPFFSVQQGWTVDDTEIHCGNVEIIVSKLDRTASAAAR